MTLTVLTINPNTLLSITGCWKMLTAILTASERFLDLKIISQQQPPQGVTRVFKVIERGCNVKYKCITSQNGKLRFGITRLMVKVTLNTQFSHTSIYARKLIQQLATIRLYAEFILSGQRS
jgi:hypothetical protein